MKIMELSWVQCCSADTKIIICDQNIGVKHWLADFGTPLWSTQGSSGSAEWESKDHYSHVCATRIARKHLFYWGLQKIFCVRKLKTNNIFKYLCYFDIDRHLSLGKLKSIPVVPSARSSFSDQNMISIWKETRMCHYHWGSWILRMIFYRLKVRTLALHSGTSSISNPPFYGRQSAILVIRISIYQW